MVRQKVKYVVDRDQDGFPLSKSSITSISVRAVIFCTNPAIMSNIRFLVVNKYMQYASISF